MTEEWLRIQRQTTSLIVDVLSGRDDIVCVVDVLLDPWRQFFRIVILKKATVDVIDKESLCDTRIRSPAKQQALGRMVIQGFAYTWRPVANHYVIA